MSLMLEVSGAVVSINIEININIINIINIISMISMISMIIVGVSILQTRQE